MQDRLRRLDALFGVRAKKGPAPRGRERWVADFWARVQRGKPDECWPWLGAKYADGYGRVFCRSEALRAHRVVAELCGVYGRSDGDLVLHTCDEPSCCNPSHLYLGTELDNFRDCLNRRRHPKQTLSFGQINAIRRAKKLGLLRTKEVAARFGVSRSTIQRVASGDSYGWL